METACKFNANILCNGLDKCPRCGWNPEEAARRIRAIRAGGLMVNKDGDRQLNVKGFQAK